MFNSIAYKVGFRFKFRRINCQFVVLQQKLHEKQKRPGGTHPVAFVYYSLKWGLLHHHIVHPIARSQASGVVAHIFKADGHFLANIIRKVNIAGRNPLVVNIGHASDEGRGEFFPSGRQRVAVEIS